MTVLTVCWHIFSLIKEFYVEDYYIRLIELVAICWAGGKVIVIVVVGNCNWFVFGIVNYKIKCDVRT